MESCCECMNGSYPTFGSVSGGSGVLNLVLTPGCDLVVEM